MVTAVVESPLRQRHRHRLRSPLADGAGSTTTTGGGGGDVEFRHSRPAKRGGSGSGDGMRGRRWVPPEIEIPANGLQDAAGARGGGGGRGYTSLRDIMTSPEYAAAAKAAAISPDEAGVDVHMIRHPLVKHAAYTYLQLTPAAREEARRRMLRRRQGPLCRLVLGCLGFLGALFGRQ